MSKRVALTTPNSVRPLVLADIASAACDRLKSTNIQALDTRDVLVLFKGELVKAALAQTNGNLCAAARLMGIHRNVASRWKANA